jgi:hypothetical protein
LPYEFSWHLQIAGRFWKLISVYLDQKFGPDGQGHEPQGLTEGRPNLLLLRGQNSYGRKFNYDSNGILTAFEQQTSHRNAISLAESATIHNAYRDTQRYIELLVALIMGRRRPGWATSCLWVAWLGVVEAAMKHQHHLFAGSFSGSSIYGITFDDGTNRMNVSRTPTNRVDNEWLAISYDGKTLYSSGSSGWSTFSIGMSPMTHSPSQNTAVSPNLMSLVVSNEVHMTPTSPNCTSWLPFNIIASRKSPFPVYGSLSCSLPPTLLSPDGHTTVWESPTFNERAAVYGMALDPTSNYLYTADWRAGMIWTHKVNSDGTLTSLGGVEAPSSVSAPRSIAVHPSGRAMYVALEGWNAVALYTIDSRTKLPSYSKGLYTLVPPGMDH